MDEAGSATDTSISDSSSAIENFDFSKPDGGLSEDYQQQESNDSGDVTTDEADRPENAEKQTDDSQEDEQSQVETDDVSKMTPEERNNWAAQRRIAAKTAGKQADESFLGQLRDVVRGDYIDIDPNEDAYEDMDPQVAEQLRELRQSERAREAERAIERIATVRETTRLGILQAESSVPMFNEADPTYNQTLHNMALSNYAHRYLEVRPGPDGEPQIVGTKEGAPSPLEYLQEQAQEFEGILKAERLSGQMTAQRNSSRADIGSSSAPAPAGNSVGAIESRIGDIPLNKF